MSCETASKLTCQQIVNIALGESNDYMQRYYMQKKDESSEDSRDVCIMRSMRRAIGALMGEFERERKADGWIECSDQLPEGKAKIIDSAIYYKDLYVQYGCGTLVIAFYDEEGGQWFNRLGMPLDDIVRWCDCLTELPKEDRS